MNMQEQILDSEYLYHGRILNLRKDTVQLADGQQASREIVEHAPAAVILPFAAPDRLYLIRQYRIPARAVLLEASAGLLNPHEEPLAGAQRELSEETGLIARRWTKLGEFYPTPGFCEEYMHFYLAEDLSFGPQNMDADERIELVSVTLAEMDQMIREQKIIDGKTALIYLLFRQLHLCSQH